MSLIKSDVFGLDSDLTHPRNRVSGVHAKVRQQLVNLRGVYLDWPQVRSRYPDKINILTDQPLKYLKHCRNAVVQIQDYRRHSLPAGKGQQLLGEVSGTLSGRPDFRKIRINWLRSIDLPHREFSVTEDHT